MEDGVEGEIRLKRFAIQYKNRLFVVEYYRGDKIYRKNIRIQLKKKLTEEPVSNRHIYSSFYFLSLIKLHLGYR